MEGELGVCKIWAHYPGLLQQFRSVVYKTLQADLIILVFRSRPLFATQLYVWFNLLLKFLASFLATVLDLK